VITVAGFVVDNNLESLIVDNPLSAGATTLNITATTGANFPSTFPYRLTIWDEVTYIDPTDDSNMEIVECTGRTVDALTISRGKESTGDVEHANGSRVAMLITAGMFNAATYGIQPQIDALSAAGFPAVDTQTIVKGSADATKLMRFEADGITTSTTRVLTLQDKDITIADNTDILFEIDTISVSETTIAFVNSDPDTITDSGSGFLTAGFEAGQIIVITTTSGTNDGTYTIASVAAGTITLIAADSLTTENAATAGTVAIVASAIQPKSVNNILKIVDLDGDSHMQLGFELDDVGLLQLVGGDELRVRLDNELFLHNYGTYNTFLGEAAGNTGLTGSNTVGIGVNSLMDLTSGDNNVAVGKNTLLDVTTQNGNTAIGSGAGQACYSVENVLIGAHVMSGTWGTYTGNGKNTLVGYSVTYLGGGTPNDFEECTIMGYLAASALERGHRNTIIGSYAGTSLLDGTNNIYLGYYSGYYSTDSNELFIDSLDRTNKATSLIQSLIYGVINADPAQQELHFNAKIQAHGVVPLTKTDDYTIALNDFGKSLRMNNAGAKTFTLPSVGANDDGARLTICKIGAGQVTVATADTDSIYDSAGGGTLVNSSAETYAVVVIEYCHTTTTWNAVSLIGTWATP